MFKTEELLNCSKPQHARPICGPNWCPVQPGNWFPNDKNVCNHFGPNSTWVSSGYHSTWGLARDWIWNCEIVGHQELDLSSNVFCVVGVVACNFQLIRGIHTPNLEKFSCFEHAEINKQHNSWGLCPRLRAPIKGTLSSPGATRNSEFVHVTVCQPSATSSTVLIGTFRQITSGPGKVHLFGVMPLLFYIYWLP